MNLPMDKTVCYINQSHCIRYGKMFKRSSYFQLSSLLYFKRTMTTIDHLPNNFVNLHLKLIYLSFKLSFPNPLYSTLLIVPVAFKFQISRTVNSFIVQLIIFLQRGFFIKFIQEANQLIILVHQNRTIQLPFSIGIIPIYVYANHIII